MHFRECSVNGTKYREVNGKLVPEGMTDDAPDGSTPNLVTHIYVHHIHFLLAVTYYTYTFFFTAAVKPAQPSYIDKWCQQWLFTTGYSCDQQWVIGVCTKHEYTYIICNVVSLYISTSDSKSYLIYVYNDGEEWELMVFLPFSSPPVVTPFRLEMNCYFSRRCRCVTQFRSAMTSLTAWLGEETHSLMPTVSPPVTWNTMPRHRMRKL